MKFFSRKSDPMKELEKQTRKNTLANSRPIIPKSASVDSNISQASTLNTTPSSGSSLRSTVTFSRSSTKSSSKSTDSNNNTEKPRKTKHVDDQIIAAWNQANMHQVFFSCG
jgi:hypothetical protein